MEQVIEIAKDNPFAKINFPKKDGKRKLNVPQFLAQIQKWLKDWLGLTPLLANNPPKHKAAKEIQDKLAELFKWHSLEAMENVLVNALMDRERAESEDDYEQWVCGLPEAVM